MQIIRPTERIEVIESKKQCKTGSTGYLAYQQPLDIYNICRSLIVFTKFGNKGKNRIEVIPLTTELVDINTMKLTTKAMATLKESIPISGIMPKYPDKYYTINSSIKKVPMLSKSIIDLDIWDFFGYICSLSLFIKSLSTDGTKLPLPGRDGLSTEEVLDIDIAAIPQIALANFIYLALNCAKLSEAGINGERSERLFSLYMDHFNDPHNRTVCMDKMYLLLSTFREGVLKYSNWIIKSHRDMNSRIKAAIANKNGAQKYKRASTAKLAKMAQTITIEQGNTQRQPTVHWQNGPELEIGAEEVERTPEVRNTGVPTRDEAHIGAEEVEGTSEVRRPTRNEVFNGYRSAGESYRTSRQQSDSSPRARPIKVRQQDTMDAWEMRHEEIENR